MFYFSAGRGSWSFNTMHNPNTVTIKPAIPHTNGVSWNPDAIDVTVNPNKGRKGLKTIHNTAA